MNQVNKNTFVNARNLAKTFTFLVLIQSFFLNQDANANRLVAESMAAYGNQNPTLRLQPSGTSLETVVPTQYLRRNMRSPSDSTTPLADMLNNIPKRRQTRDLQNETTRRELNNQLSVSVVISDVIINANSNNYILLLIAIIALDYIIIFINLTCTNIYRYN